MKHQLLFLALTSRLANASCAKKEYVLVEEGKKNSNQKMEYAKAKFDKNPGKKMGRAKITPDAILS